jgi:hypothetical protein
MLMISALGLAVILATAASHVMPAEESSHGAEVSTEADEPIQLTMDRDELTWTEPTGETSYDVVQGDLQTLRATEGAYIAATQSCIADDHVLPSLLVTEDPDTAGEGFWYLVRGEVSTRGYESFGVGQFDGRDGEINVSDGACPDYRCAADIPPFYEQTNRIAAGACIEARPLDGPACAEEQYLRADRDITLIKDTYWFTRSVENAVVPNSGHGQVFNPEMDVLLCYGFEQVPESQLIFDDLNACYRATSKCLFNCGQVWPEFDWMVRVTDLIEIYEAVAAPHGGECGLNYWYGLPPGPTPGFHATDLGGGNWRWLVRATEQCDMEGCRCDGWVQVVISETEEITEEELVNQSTGNCAGARWDF